MKENKNKRINHCDKRELELYLHIPFCVRKCAYCDFLSMPADEAARQEYVDTLIQEISGYREEFCEYHVTTVFVGGGTPSLLTAEQISAVFDALKCSFEIDLDAEITIEANPGTVTEEKAEAWKRAGINRVSIGLQSVNDEELRMLGRIHDYWQFLDTYHLLREKGFENLNIDLISAIPGQTLKSWRETLRTVAELEPEHISAYSLIIEEGTPFYERYGDADADVERDLKTGRKLPALPDAGSSFVEKGSCKLPALPDEETERAIYEDTERILRKYGYARYEISNYSKAGYECRHNIGYWKRVEYLGIGLGASSLIGIRRFRNISQYQSYVEAVQKGADIREEREELSLEDQMEEFMFLGLRMTGGVSRQRFRELFGREMEEVYREPLHRMAELGLLKCEGDTVRLTRRGIDLSNYVFEQFLL